MWGHISSIPFPSLMGYTSIGVWEPQRILPGLFSELGAVSKPLITVTTTITVRSANFRSASIWLTSASIREDWLQ